MSTRVRGGATVAAVWLAGLLLGGALLTSLSHRGICVLYPEGTGPHAGDGCTSDTVLTLDVQLWLAVAAATALIALAVVLWLRLQFTARTVVAATAASPSAALGLAALSDHRVANALGELVAAL